MEKTQQKPITREVSGLAEQNEDVWLGPEWPLCRGLSEPIVPAHQHADIIYTSSLLLSPHDDRHGRSPALGRLPRCNKPLAAQHPYPKPHPPMLPRLISHPEHLGPAFSQEARVRQCGAGLSTQRCWASCYHACCAPVAPRARSRACHYAVQQLAIPNKDKPHRRRLRLVAWTLAVT